MDQERRPLDCSHPLLAGHAWEELALVATGDGNLGREGRTHEDRSRDPRSGTQ